MCGIAAIFKIKEQTQELRKKALEMAKKIRHRGPDWSGIYCGGSAILAHERLSIVDPQSGGQPLYSPDKKQILAVNGEIYNHREIRERFKGRYEFQTGSDCEVILALYREKGTDFLEDLSGIFAFALYDEEKDDFLIARDPIGVIPLYIGRDKEGKIYCASELKALEGFCDSYEPFLPGHCYIGSEGVMKRWYTRDWMKYDESLPETVSSETYQQEVRTRCAGRCRPPPTDERRALRSIAVRRSGQFGHLSHRQTVRCQTYRDRRTERCLVATTSLICRRPGRFTRLGQST